MPASPDELCGPAGHQLHGGELQKPSLVSNILSLVCADASVRKPAQLFSQLGFY